jgi:hypothetical protein
VVGSCLCGAVRYEIAGPLQEIHHCHCSRCRKAHGAAFSTFAGVRRGDLRFLRGEESVRYFQSSEQVERGFCAACGSNLIFRSAALPDTLWVAAGSFDEAPEIEPSFHMFVKSKAPWHDITDSLAQHDDYPRD